VPSRPAAQFLKKVDNDGQAFDSRILSLPHHSFQTVPHRVLQLEPYRHELDIAASPTSSHPTPQRRLREAVRYLVHPNAAFTIGTHIERRELLLAELSRRFHYTVDQVLTIFKSLWKHLPPQFLCTATQERHHMLLTRSHSVAFLRLLK
jgi:hypothetical protein